MIVSRADLLTVAPFDRLLSWRRGADGRGLTDPDEGLRLMTKALLYVITILTYEPAAARRSDRQTPVHNKIERVPTAPLTP
ncbi:MAG: hypothetical protein LBK46_09335 [Oscillospiraceae bacterium]|nr:hypothetical protein [Oscillospiraceae bacterium]